MKFSTLFLVTWALFFSHNSFAQTVTNVKGAKVLIDLDGQDWAAGDRVFALDEQGKKKALLQIKQVRNGKAIAEIVKGKANSGMSVAMGRKGGGGGDNSAGSSVVRGLRSGSAWGYTGALMMNQMKISNFNNNSFTMSGTNFGAGLFYDYPMTRSWFVRAHGTFEMFDVQKKLATPICKNGTSTDCNASFMQAGLYGTFNMIFTPSPYRFWAGGGGGAIIYLSKESTVLSTSKFFFNTALIVAAGFDIFTSRNTFIPLSFEYQTIPDKEAGVTSMVLRAGWGKTF